MNYYCPHKLTTMIILFKFAICILVGHVVLCQECPFARPDSGKMHSELFHIFVPKEGTTLNPKAFGSSICKLPNPDNLTREQLDQRAIEQGCLAPFNTLAANILRASKADNVSLVIVRDSLCVLDLYRQRQGKKVFTTCKEEKRICRPPVVKCDPNYKYRSFDGGCNNLKHPTWGQSRRAYGRFIPPAYSDGFSELRMAKDGYPLPSPRLVSTTIVQEISMEFPDISLLTNSFGQLVGHDLTQAVSFRADDFLTFECCKAAQKKLYLSECLPINIPADDPHYANLNVTCLSNMRSGVDKHSWCDGEIPVRQQLNQLNSYIDASVLYGANDADYLRSFKDGRLLTGKIGNADREFPPHFSNNDCKEDLANGKICVQLGDMRGSEQPPIATQQIMLIRFHNYVCKELKMVNPNWADEILYQESRKIMGAIFQQIIYSEFLPVLLGDKLMTSYGLKLRNYGFHDEYDENVNATTFNEFGAAAFRYGHSTVPGTLKVVESNNAYFIQKLNDQVITTYDTKFVDQYIKGFVTQRGELVDSGLSKELTNNLFKKDGPFGHDLASLNINRGRDHGLPGYTKYREACRLKPVRSFEDLQMVMDPTVAELFREVYTSVEDIDLWVAGIAETPRDGAIIGPTFACIIAQQFSNLKKGDRFWHERGGQITSFTRDQLREIRKILYAGMFCQVSDVKMMQKNVMRSPNPASNPVFPCSSNEAFPKINFNYWKEPAESCS